MTILACQSWGEAYMGPKKPFEVAKLFSPVFPSVDDLSPVLISHLCASVALEMNAVPGGHGEEAGDGPEAGRDSSPLSGCSHGGVCRHHVLHPGHDRAAALPEKVPNPPGLPPFSSLSSEGTVCEEPQPSSYPSPLTLSPGRKVWIIVILRVKDSCAGRVDQTGLGFWDLWVTDTGGHLSTQETPNAPV